MESMEQTSYMHIYNREYGLKHHKHTQSTAENSTKRWLPVLASGVDVDLARHDQADEECVVGENQISSDDSASAFHVEEVAEGGVEAVEHIADDVHGEIVDAVPLDPKCTHTYDLYLKFSYTCP